MWEDLSSELKSDLMKLGIQHQVYNVNDLKNIYNKFIEGRYNRKNRKTPPLVEALYNQYGNGGNLLGGSRAARMQGAARAGYIGATAPQYVPIETEVYFEMPSYSSFKLQNSHRSNRNRPLRNKPLRNRPSNSSRRNRRSRQRTLSSEQQHVGQPPVSMLASLYMDNYVAQHPQSPFVIPNLQGMLDASKPIKLNLVYNNNGRTIFTPVESDKLYAMDYDEKGRPKLSPDAYVKEINDAQLIIDYGIQYLGSEGFRQRLNRSLPLMQQQARELYGLNGINVTLTPYQDNPLKGLIYIPSNRYENPGLKSSKMSNNILTLLKPRNGMFGYTNLPFTGQLAYYDHSLSTGHEFGHKADDLINIKPQWNLDNLINGFNPTKRMHKSTYSSLFPILNQSNAYRLSEDYVRNNMNKADYNLFKNNLTEFQKKHPLIHIHDAKSGELYADLWGLRMDLHKLGIFDSTLPDNIFTKDMLQEYKRKKFKEGPMQRLFYNYSDDDIVWMINNIAQNDQHSEETPENSNISAYGGKLKSNIYKKGGKLKPWKALDNIDYVPIADEPNVLVDEVIVTPNQYANGGPVNLFADGGYNVNAYRNRHRSLLRRGSRRTNTSAHREQRQLPAGRKRYLDDVSPGYTARMDSTLPYQRQAEEAGNRAYDRAASNARTHREQTRIRHQQINYNTQLARRTRQNSTGVIPSRREQLAQQQDDRETRQWQQAIENLTPDVPIVVARQEQDQLWDKDKVDLARTQQAFYRDAYVNTGVNWGNNLNPYTQQDLIQNAAKAFGTSNLVPYTLPAFGALSGSMSAPAFIASSIGGEAGGLVGSAVGESVSDNPYAGIIGGAIGGLIGGSGSYLLQQAPYIRLANAINNNAKRVSLSTRYPTPLNHTRWYDHSAYATPVRPISVAEELGIPKGERAMFNPQVVANAKQFADRYGYPMPTTIEGIKDMYRRHNTFFRTVKTNPFKPYEGIQTQSQIDTWYPQFIGMSDEDLVKNLASRGYPKFLKTGDVSDIGQPSAEDFVFVSPSLSENKLYQPFGQLYNTVRLLRPFSFRDPLNWHIDADWDPVAPISNGAHGKGVVSQGNAGLKFEAKIGTEHLIPIRLAEPEDLGTLRLQQFHQALYPKDFPDAINGIFPQYTFLQSNWK